MDVTPLISKNAQVIQAYAHGVFKVSGHSFDGPVLITPDQTVAWDVSGFDTLSLSDFEVVGRDIDVLLLGTGKTMAFLPLKLRQELKNSGLSVDCMDTGAASRTYNVLMAEGRRVSAALLPYL